MTLTEGYFKLKISLTSKKKKRRLPRIFESQHSRAKIILVGLKPELHLHLPYPMMI